MKGIGKETTVNSVIEIYTTADGSKISKLLDKWDGELPDSSITTVSSIFQLLNPFWWFHYFEGWLWWFWSFIWWTRGPWLVCRVNLAWFKILTLARLSVV